MPAACIGIWKPKHIIENAKNNLEMFMDNPILKTYNQYILYYTACPKSQKRRPIKHYSPIWIQIEIKNDCSIWIQT